MRNLFNWFKKEQSGDFTGGIFPPEMKHSSNSIPLRHIPLPECFIMPLKQHMGDSGELCVKPGDKVLRGQPLTLGYDRMLPIHAPTSGTIDAIAPHITAHPSGLPELSIFITPDGKDQWIARETLNDYQQLTRSELIARIYHAGVAGLGGAGFPTNIKLKGGLKGVKTLIINAAECEPYITADDRLMREHADEILQGSRILAGILQPDEVLIGIEDNKSQAIVALKQALGFATDLTLKIIPTKYPSGGAKQLTKILTGKEVPQGGRSSDIGVLMQNVGTAFAVKRAVIDGEPLTERVVTLTGGSVSQPGNLWGRLGTPIRHLLHHAGFTPEPDQRVVMGGPLMGFTLPVLDVPMVKITNCILAPTTREISPPQPEQSCIRCSACADVCPVNLLPQQLYWYSQGADHQKARAHFIEDCIECGACAYVCPSHIPLVQYYRQEKAELRAIDVETQRAAQAKTRFTDRQKRLAREKQAREARHQQTKREAELRNQHQTHVAANEKITMPSATTEMGCNNTQTIDARKAAVEAAIARVEAKKNAQQSAKQKE